MPAYEISGSIAVPYAELWTYPPNSQIASKTARLAVNEVYNGTVVGASTMDGSLSSVTPPTISTETTGGAVSGSFFDHWYNRIHVIPPFLEVGNVTVDTQTSIEVWNAYLNSVSMTSEDLANEAGIVVSGGPSAPTTLLPLGIYTYDITVQEQGPANVDINLGWTINGVQVRFTLTATRVVPFFYAPDWSSGVVETLEWRTTVYESYSGQEQRQQIRAKPRRETEYRVILEGSEARSAKFDILGFQNKTLGLPVWQDKARTTGAFNAGDLVIPVPTTDKSFEAGGLVFIVNGGTPEVLEIDSVTSTTIVVKRAATNSYPEGSYVYPGVVTSLPPSVSFSAPTSRVLTGAFRFADLPGDSALNLPSTAAAKTLDSYEVYERKPDWRNGIGFNFDSTFEDVDFLSGARQRVQTRAYPATRVQLRYVLDTRAEMSDFRAFLARRTGRLNPVWVNPLTEDFVLAVNASSGATGLQFEDNHADLSFDPAEVPTALAITTGNGTNYYRVSSMSLAESGNVAVTLASGLVENATVGEVKRVSLLMLSRLSSDRVSLKWLSDRVAEVEIDYVTVSA